MQADSINSHLNTVNAEILILNKERYSPHFSIITVRLKIDTVKRGNKPFAANVSFFALFIYTFQLILDYF